MNGMSLRLNATSSRVALHFGVVVAVVLSWMNEWRPKEKVKVNYDVP